MASWYAIRACGREAEVTIYDEIGAFGNSAKGFLDQLGAIPDGTPIDLRLNSPGGSVFDAVAIHNALTRHAGRVTVWIDGIAASAASYVAMAGDEIVMPENAFLMIHDPQGLMSGSAGDMRSMAEALDKVKGSLVQGYAARSGKAAETVASLMAAETWFGAADAVAEGFADRLAPPVRIAARFDTDRFRNAPGQLAEPAANEPESADPIQPDGETSDGSPETDDESRAVAPEAQTALPDAAAIGGAPPDPATVRAGAIAHARAIVDLCQLAGQPQMAARFLDGNIDLEEVRAALLAARAGSEPDIASQHPQPGRGTRASPWGEIVARTFKQKGTS
ncbi:head maturation protease, ClpP-related [Roseibium sp. RKSG952]|uniref:head maturation protease, ClpP-related n=1 Tax=Roseibium sp. RKSG952 TaxID=2529384 RepID=UPI0018AD2B06|nr:head maturation protease, ClpP-related [Roseibium sp. RKSG952]